MANGNNVTIIGNCTRDPELKFTNSGAAVTSFGLAWNNRWQNKTTQEWEESVHFFDVTVWRQQGENAAESFGKGDRITVVGRLDQQQWETADGDKRSKVVILADEVSVSVKYATLEVTKNPRTTSEPAGGYPGADQQDY